MNLLKNISAIFQEHLQVIEAMPTLHSAELICACELITKSLLRGGTLFWCGNGGSAADSQHLAAEFVGRFKKDRKALRSIALTTDTSILTCVANDYSYDNIFSRQLEALASSDDVLVAISTSGDSKNVLRALKVAKDLNLKTIALLGKGGGSH